MVQVSDKGRGVMWSTNSLAPDGNRFEVFIDGHVCGTVEWGQLPRHNLQNALVALAAAHHAG